MNRPTPNTTPYPFQLFVRAWFSHKATKKRNRLLPHGELAPCGAKFFASLEHEPTPDTAPYPFRLFVRAWFDSVRIPKDRHRTFVLCLSFGSPTGTRTPVFAVRGRRLNRLTMRPFPKLLDDYSINKGAWQAVFGSFSKKIKKVCSLQKA